MPVPASNYAFRVELVCTTELPTLEVDGVTYNLQLITLAELASIVDVLSDYDFYANVSPSKKRQAFAEKARLRLSGTTYTKKFLPLDSSPFGRIWISQPQAHYHPATDGGYICVATYSGKTTTYWQLRIWVASLPELSGIRSAPLRPTVLR